MCSSDLLSASVGGSSTTSISGAGAGASASNDVGGTVEAGIRNVDGVSQSVTANGVMLLQATNGARIQDRKSVV